MNWLDIVFIGILSLSIIISLFRGLIREVLSLAIWIGAFWIAYSYVDEGANALLDWIELPSARHLIAFVILFLSSLIIGGMVNFLVTKLINKTGLSGSDRFFGMFFGALRGLLVIIVITFFIKATPLSEDPWWQESQMAPHFSKISEWVRTKMPDEFSQYFSFIENQKDDETNLPLDNIQELLESIDNKQENQPDNNEKQLDDKVESPEDS